jgi:predicted DNA-binding protein YlxM (UPF0122 family)
MGAKKIEIDLDLLKTLHCDEELPLEYLAQNVFYVSRQTLYNRLKEYNLKKERKQFDLNLAIHLYEVEKKGLYEIANQLNFSHTKVYNQLKKNNIKIRTNWDWHDIRREKNGKN